MVADSCQDSISTNQKTSKDFQHLQILTLYPQNYLAKPFIDLGPSPSQRLIEKFGPKPIWAISIMGVLSIYKKLYIEHTIEVNYYMPTAYDQKSLTRNKQWYQNRGISGSQRINFEFMTSRNQYMKNNPEKAEAEFILVIQELHTEPKNY